MRWKAHRTTDYQARLLELVQIPITTSLWGEIEHFLYFSTHQSDDLELAREWQAFKTREAHLSNLPITDPVRPSNSIRSKLAINLHCATPATSNRENCESADISNPCTRLLILKGLKWCAFWYELFFRRVKPQQARSFQPSQGWSEDLCKAHQAFFSFCETSAHGISSLSVSNEYALTIAKLKSCFSSAVMCRSRSESGTLASSNSRSRLTVLP